MAYWTKKQEIVFKHTAYVQELDGLFISLKFQSLTLMPSRFEAHGSRFCPVCYSIRQLLGCPRWFVRLFVSFSENLQSTLTISHILFQESSLLNLELIS